MLSLSLSGLREFLDRLPTTDLYFLNPLAELKRQGIHLPSPRPIGQHAYLLGRTGVIVRYGSADSVARLRGAGAKRIIYIVDDDFAAGASDPSLPPKYREKLAAFAEREWPAVKEAADIVIVPGAVLAKTYGAKAKIIPPAWDGPPASTEHFVAPKHIEIVHLGTGSHRGDLAPLSEPLANLLRAHPRARLTLFAGNNAPDALKNHPQVVSRRRLAWWRYKRVLPRLRFHLALYPLSKTPFNAARSANKFFEHALVGAASLMSPNPALRAAAGDDLADIFVEREADWIGQIEAMLKRPGAMTARVETTFARIFATDPLAHAAAQWKEILGVEP